MIHIMYDYIALDLISSLSLQEPHANGPLFCELHFYMRIAKPEMSE